MFVVAIDGPAGAGKSSVARGVAARTGLTRVDTGAIYRAVTLAVLRRGTPPAGWSELTAGLDLRFEGLQVFMEGEDVSHAIRTAEVDGKVSEVSADPGVRSHLLDVQRSLAARSTGGALLEGRDIGSVVFPDAALKVFLTASDEERARRRLAERPGDGTFEEILEAIRRRDAYDRGRPVAPLVQPEGAVVVDSSKLSQAEVEDRIVQLIDQARTT
ncbi:MAG: (d)CMP kinase [Myxococcota bacterium]